MGQVCMSKTLNEHTYISIWMTTHCNKCPLSFKFTRHTWFYSNNTYVISKSNINWCTKWWDTPFRACLVYDVIVPVSYKCGYILLTFRKKTRAETRVIRFVFLPWASCFKIKPLFSQKSSSIKVGKRWVGPYQF
jgi:hypothetical protein